MGSKFKTTYEHPTFQGKPLLIGEVVTVSCPAPAGGKRKFFRATIVGISNGGWITVDWHAASKKGTNATVHVTRAINYPYVTGVKRDE